MSSCNFLSVHYILIGASDTICDRSPPQRIEGPGPKNLQLHFKTRMPPHLFTGGKVEGEQGGVIHVVVLDPNTGHVVQTGPDRKSVV